METFLYTWNPKRWPWSELEEDLRRIHEFGSVNIRWSCGSRRKLPVASRIFLIRVGTNQNGIIGSGYTTSKVFYDTHWGKDKALRGLKAHYTYLRFDVLSKSPLISLDELQKLPFSVFRWTYENSGVRIPDEMADLLEREWVART